METSSVYFSFYMKNARARACARSGPVARGTPLCEAHGRAQLPLLPHESGAACGCSGSEREREETPPSLNATSSPCQPRALRANLRANPRFGTLSWISGSEGKAVALQTATWAVVPPLRPEGGVVRGEEYVTSEFVRMLHSLHVGKTPAKSSINIFVDFIFYFL